MERYHTKAKVWSGIKTFWTIQKNYPEISSIKKLNKRKAAISMSTFDFSTLYTKIPHGKLLYVLNEITDFAFDVAQEIMLMFLIQGHFGHAAKVRLGDLTLSKK